MANPLIAPRRPHASPIRRAGRVEEGIWSQPPTRAVAPLSGRLDEPVTLTELAVAHALSRPWPCTRRTQTNGTRSNPGTAPTTPPGSPSIHLMIPMPTKSAIGPHDSERIPQWTPQHHGDGLPCPRRGVKTPKSTVTSFPDAGPSRKPAPHDDTRPGNVSRSSRKSPTRPQTDPLRRR